MNKIIADIINNNFESFEKLTVTEKNEFLIYVSKHNIKNPILLKLLNTDYWYDIKFEIFDLIYKDNTFIHNTISMLVNGIIELKELTEEQLNYIINTEWGLQFILKHNDIMSRNYFLLVKIINNKQSFEKALSILENCKTITKITFIYEALCLDKTIDDNYIKKILSNQEYELPKWFIESRKTRPVIIRNFNFFIEMEAECKMKLIDTFKDEVSEDTYEQYKPFLKLYSLYKEKSVDVFITRLINANEESKLLPYLNDK